MKTQRVTIEQLQSTVATLQSAVARQAAQFQEVSSRLKATQSAPRVVENR